MRSFDGIQSKPNFNWKKLVQQKTELQRLKNLFNLLLNSKVKIFRERSEFLDNETLNVGGEIVKSKKLYCSRFKAKSYEFFKLVKI